MNESSAHCSKANDSRRKPKCILPGSTVGILGGGQLGRMLCIEAKKLGYRVGILDPGEDSPAAQVADFQITAAFDDADAVRRLAERCDVLTFEFENVRSAELRAAVGERCEVHPSPEVLHTAQNREREKCFLRGRGFPCAPFEVVDCGEQLQAAVEKIGLPAILKTADFGYDGKGQLSLSREERWEEIWASFGAERAILERRIPFAAELSVICARWKDGTLQFLPAAENIHRNGILHQSIVPARLPESILESARELAGEITTALNVVGLLAVEMFLQEDGSLLVNELAPRPHNSGHFSFDACMTSQFEQHLRAICGLPPGSFQLLSPVVMGNLLGDLWKEGEPDWAEMLRNSRLKLHLYGKSNPLPGRKMGHLCVLTPSVESALADVNSIFHKEKGSPSQDEEPSV